MRRADQLEDAIEQRQRVLEHAANLIDDGFGVQRLGLEVDVAVAPGEIGRLSGRGDRFGPLRPQSVDARLAAECFGRYTGIRVLRRVLESTERLSEVAGLLQGDAFSQWGAFVVRSAHSGRTSHWCSPSPAERSARRGSSASPAHA